MSCTRMVQYLQLVHLDSAEVDLVARADPAACGPMVLGNFVLEVVGTL